MTEDNQDVVTIPIADIEILNPRIRNRKIFDELVESIATVGLKRPITVAARPGGRGYDLVCGQGRLEALIQLGQTHIPAIVINAPREDCYVISLVENLARRNQSPLELIREVGALRDRGYGITEVAKKIGYSAEYVSAICTLLDNGEERLLDAVERGVIPHKLAVEIARSDDADTQRALTDVYESGMLPGDKVIALRKIIDARAQIGKGLCSARNSNKGGGKPTAASLVRVYRKEVERQKLLVKKAAIAQSRLLFIVNALRKLLAEEHFATLLRAEAMDSLPLPLAQRVGIAARSSL